MSKKKFIPTPEQAAATQLRDSNLRAASNIVRELMNLGLLNPMPTTINEGLLFLYRSQNNFAYASEFHKFDEWKERGRKVKKGSEGFAVWTAPIKGEGKKETEKGIEIDPYKFWGKCYLFHESQTEPI